MVNYKIFHKYFPVTSFEYMSYFYQLFLNLAFGYFKKLFLDNV